MILLKLISEIEPVQKNWLEMYFMAFVASAEKIYFKQSFINWQRYQLAVNVVIGSFHCSFGQLRQACLVSE